MRYNVSPFCRHTGRLVIYSITGPATAYISPLLNSLSKLHRFDVETQIQYFAPLLVERHVTAEGAIIDEDQLKAFVNSAEWNLGTRQCMTSMLWRCI